MLNADSISSRLPSPLRPYQLQGVEFLATRDAALLADEMGLGKTVMVSVALELLYQRRQLHRALIVVPASLKSNWDVEINRWAPSLSVQRVRGSARDRQAWYRLPVTVLLASYEELRLDSLSFPTDVSFDVVVLDEAQRIKNSDARTALACTALRRSRSWALTGTPIENRVDDLVSVFRFVKRGILSPGMTRSELHRLMQPFLLRRRKQEVLKDLPPIIIQDILVQLGQAQRDAYFKLWDSRFGDKSGDSSGPENNPLAIITRLKQLCNFDPDSGESAKLDILADYLDAQYADDDKVVVFSQYVTTLRWLAVNVRNIPTEIYSGDLALNEREAVLDRFRNLPGPRLLFISLRAGGVGLNIQEASVVVLFDRWWNPALESQAIQRAHRFGRERPLHVIRLLVANTIEERIESILLEKRLLFENYVETADSAELPDVSRQILDMILERPRYERS